MSLTLSELLRRSSCALPGAEIVSGDPAAAVGGVSSDSRTLSAGDLFVVLQGTVEDGTRYAAAAVERGACAVVAPSGGVRELLHLGVPLVAVDDPRTAVAVLAGAFHGFPARSMTMVGVTGTNGKTTTAHLVASVLEHGGRGPCARLGTISYAWPGEEIAAGNTTPGAAELHALLARAHVAGGCRSAALEVSSHALDQRRVEGIDWDAAIFTNLSGDHLDYHRSMEEYAVAKARLFQGLGPHAVAAVNAEDGYAPTMARDTRARVVTFGLDAPSAPEVTARAVEMTVDGMRFVLVTPQGEAQVSSPLVGRYNLLNLLGAAAAASGIGLPVPSIAAGLSAVAGVRGRLEPVDAGQPFRVLVDYAHTDDAVTNVLRNLRGIVPGRIIAVLGCGGDRDRTKRPRMARAAAELADRCWLTSDNPRTEDPQAILGDMLAGIYGARNVQVEPDRRRAIARAIEDAEVGDCVVLLGKGHEDYQILGREKVPFDDRLVAAAAVRELMARVHPALRTR